MQDEYTNIYQTARRRAGWTQEQAAELLDLSVESVKAYETDVRVPPAATVAAMAKAYDSPGLRLEHARRTDELGIIPEDARPRSFPLAAMQLYNYLLSWAEKRRGRQLLQIAEDGKIDEDERPLYDEIVCELEGIAAALLSLMYCDADTKSGRSEEATSKRPMSKPCGIVAGRSLLTQSVYQERAEKSRKTAAGKAVSLT